MPTVLHYIVDMGTDIWTDHMIEKLPLSTLPFFLARKSHIIIFSIGNTRIPSAPASFKCPTISQKCF